MKQSRLLAGKYAKPQNQFSEIVRSKSKKQIAEWLQEFGLVAYQANLLANELLSRAMSDRIQNTSNTASDVYFSDADKIDSLVMNAKRIADAIDESGELESLLGELEDKDNHVDSLFSFGE